MRARKTGIYLRGWRVYHSGGSHPRSRIAPMNTMRKAFAYLRASGKGREAVIAFPSVGSHKGLSWPAHRDSARLRGKESVGGYWEFRPRGWR